MCSGGIHDSGSRLIINSSRRCLASARSPFARFFGVIAEPRTYASLFYMLLALATGIFYFTWVVTGVSLSGGLAVLIIGIPFVILYFGSVRVLSVLPQDLAAAGAVERGEQFVGEEVLVGQVVVVLAPRRPRHRPRPRCCCRQKHSSPCRQSQPPPQLPFVPPRDRTLPRGSQNACARPRRPWCRMWGRRGLR